MEEDEALDVFVERTAPLDGPYYAAERVVEERHVAGVLCHTGARAERKTHVGMVECRCVVGAVAGYGHHLAAFLQQIDQPLLVGWPCAAHYLQFRCAAVGCFVGQSLEVRPRDVCFLWRIAVPGSDLPGYFHRRSLRVARYNLHVDAGTAALAHGFRHFRTQRVADSRHALQRQRSVVGTWSVCGFAVCQRFAGESQCAHGLVLIAEQPLLDGFAVGFGHGAERRYYLRRTFYKKIASLIGVGNSGHVLALGGERLLPHRAALASKPLIVGSATLQPQQQSRLGGVADGLVAIQIGRCVGRNGRFQ